MISASGENKVRGRQTSSHRFSIRSEDNPEELEDFVPLVFLNLLQEIFRVFLDIFLPFLR